MENNNNNITVYKIVENKAYLEGLHAGSQLEAEIQVAYLNMLHEQGLLTETTHSIATSKIMKGAI